MEEHLLIDNLVHNRMTNNLMLHEIHLNVQKKFVNYGTSNRSTVLAIYVNFLSELQDKKNVDALLETPYANIFLFYQYQRTYTFIQLIFVLPP